MGTKEPWNNEIYQAMKENPEDLNRKERTKNQSKKPLTTRFLTFLVILMFVLIGLGLTFVLWNSALQGSKPVSAFNNGSTSSSVTSKASASSSSSAQSTDSTSTSTSTSTSSATSSSSSAATGSTYTIVAGDTPTKIAAKTGVSWSVIASLNNISAAGYNSDGSAIYAGQVIKLK